MTHSHHVNAAPALAAAPVAGYAGYAGFPALAHHQAVAAPAVVA